MDPIKIPELQPMVTDDIVAVPKGVFNSLIDYVNQLNEVVVLQTEIIKAHSEELTTCKQNISNIAKILEEVYDET